MTESTSANHSQVPLDADAAIIAWMGTHGWRVASGRWYLDPDGGFHIWQEPVPTTGGNHAIWIAESMVGRLSAEQLVEALNREDVADEIRISIKVRIQERGDGYRVSAVSRSSGEWQRVEE